jgi:CRISPR/Cas system-associated exonuclease Cas4 (RecB family)
MQLTKTDFIQYLKCPKSLWMRKCDPENYPSGEVSAFFQKLTREGYEVENYVRQYFKNSKEGAVDFQRIFKTDDGLYARVDALQVTKEDKTFLYEIKSSTKVRTDNDHNHIKDACFQKICAERSGQRIDRVFLIHLNGDYVRAGEIDPSNLLTFIEVTEEVLRMFVETEAEIDEALQLLQKTQIDKGGCSCLMKSSAHHCDTFSIFNPEVPRPSIYSLPRMSAKKRHDLISKRVFDLNDVPHDYSLSDNQQVVLQAAKSGEPQINLAEIRNFFSRMKFPLFFLDYETFASAVPFFDETSPHKHIPIQYSLHVLEEDGNLSHKEFLQREPSLPRNLVEQLEIDIGPEGNIVSWHAPFEKTQNREMAIMFTDKTNFLNDINNRMVDLEDIFKNDYVDARFDGSTSIKKVLPVICPELSYKNLKIQSGTSAMESWQRMLKKDKEQADIIAGDMLNYCERDTLAMVEIYRFIKDILGN